MVVLIDRSKTDPDGKGHEIGIKRAGDKKFCPVIAIETWIAFSGLTYGPMFRKINRWHTIERDRLALNAINRIIKNRAEAAGIKPESVREIISPHSLRAGFVTQSYAAGVSDEAIMAHTRHKSHQVMRSYIRRSSLVDESPTTKLDL
jgi:integrase